MSDSTPEIDLEKLPNHVAFIMDGNGRWAKSKNLPRAMGHKAGRKTLKKMVQVAAKLGIKYISAYTFSTENWTRPETEVSFLMNFVGKSIDEEVKEMNQQGVRIRFLGNLNGLSDSLRNKCISAMKTTEKNKTIQLNIMFNYGSREELLQAIKTLSKEPPDNITEERFSRLLYTSDTPDPDILIRSSGEYRLSNFLLWQLAYTELFFTDTFWPDFDETEFLNILHQYQSRDRRYGGLK